MNFLDVMKYVSKSARDKTRRGKPSERVELAWADVAKAKRDEDIMRKVAEEMKRLKESQP
jgi:thioredoxin-related protein